MRIEKSHINEYGFRNYHLADLYKDSNATEVQNRIVYNFMRTLDTLKTNESKGVRLYKVSNDLIPLATHEEFQMWQDRNNWYWHEDPIIISLMKSIKEYVNLHHHWLTLHLGTYNIVTGSKEYLDYAYYMMYYLGAVGITTRIGKSSEDEWVGAYKSLPQHLQDYLYIENDRHRHNVESIMNISHRTGVKPVINFTNHKNNTSPNILNYINIAGEKWPEGILIKVNKEDLFWVESLIKESHYPNTVWIMLESSR